MTIEQLKETIIELIEEYVEDMEVTEESKLITELSMSSMQIMSLIGDIEDEFGIDISISKLTSIDTVADLIEFVIDELS